MLVMYSVPLTFDVPWSSGNADSDFHSQSVSG